MLMHKADAERMPMAYMLAFMERVGGASASRGYDDGYRGRSPRGEAHAYRAAYREGLEARSRGAHR